MPIILSTALKLAILLSIPQTRYPSFRDPPLSVKEKPGPPSASQVVVAQSGSAQVKTTSAQ
ncbi:hypothetical protein CFIMG_008019RA00001 [Ceratocystis fimbriata CBS 114723]|uniref:Uncharacterized protein n=1 Tax=Ceratocystis fimbriata CBS 114723 TaxID=1035309 RepID=A0A2C5XAI9_9PEZI|nr:hypothetical protein CFIMG_008019RA00001 [Ceratocystis fimbriata CBS 114723]